MNYYTRQSDYHYKISQNCDLANTTEFIPEQGNKNPEVINKSWSRAKGFSILGLNSSNSKGFGVAFLVLFVLLFYPGFGISGSAAAKNRAKKESEQQNK